MFPLPAEKSVCDVFGICVCKMSATRCLYLCNVCVSGLCVCVLAECDSQQRLQGYRSGLSLLLVPAGGGDPRPPTLILQARGRCRKLIKTFAELINARL